MEKGQAGKSELPHRRGVWATQIPPNPPLIKGGRTGGTPVLPGRAPGWVEGERFTGETPGPLKSP